MQNNIGLRKFLKLKQVEFRCMSASTVRFLVVYMSACRETKLVYQFSAKNRQHLTFNFKVKLLQTRCFCICSIAVENNHRKIKGIGVLSDAHACVESRSD